MRVDTGQAPPFFDAGMAALMQEVLPENLKKMQVAVLYFPDMCGLLAWSRSPVLPEGRTVIVGGRRQLATLSGLFSPWRVLLLDSRMPLAVVRRILQTWLDVAPATGPSRGIRFTDHEMNLIRHVLLGRSFLLRDSKQDSRVRLRVMDKVGAGNRVALLIRLRLLFWLDRASLMQAPVYGGGWQPARTQRNGRPEESCKTVELTGQ